MIKISRIFVVAFAIVVQAASTVAQTPYEVGNDQLKIRSLKSDNGHWLIIEWLNPVKVLQKKTDQQLTLRFSQPLSINADTIFDRLQTYLDVSRTKIEGTDLELVLRPDVTTSLEIKKKRIVAIGLSRPTALSPGVEIDVESRKNGIRLVFDWPNLAEFDAREKNDNLSVTFRSNIDLEMSDLAYLNEKFQPWFSEVHSLGDPTKTKLEFILQPMIVSSIAGLGNNRVAIDFVRDASLQEEVSEISNATWRPAFRPNYPDQEKVTSENPALHLPAWRPQAIASPNEDQEEANIAASPRLKDDEAIREMAFEWNQEVGAAIFRRAGYLWVVFDAPVNSSLLPIPPPSPYPLKEGEITREGRATIIRFPMIGEADVNVTSQDGRRWIIQISTVSNQRHSIPIMPSDRPGALMATALSKGQFFETKDPIVGDQIGIWPVAQPHLGQKNRRRFVDLDILPTIQGLVWRKRNDDLRTSAIDDGIEFNTPQGLTISDWQINVSGEDERKYDIREASSPSNGEEKAEIATSGNTETAPSSYFDLAGFHLGQRNSKDERRALRQSIGKSAPEVQDQRRLDLARLLVAERHTAEAKTVLSTLSPTVAGTTSIFKRALKGASALLDGDVDEASSLLNANELDLDDEIGIWRAAIESLNEDWDKAAPIWEANRNTLDVYPPKLRLKFGLLALEAAIRSDDDNMIRVGFRRLKSLDPKPHDIAQIDRLHALRAIRDGDTKRAEEILESLVKRKLGTISLQADLELAALLFGEDANDSGLLETLDNRLPLWRGHPQEINMIDSLANWHRAAYKPRKALDLWERLSTIHPETDTDVSLQSRRKATFAETINELAGDRLSLFDAYSIYLDFLNLIPDEPDKKTLHLSLARHLTNLDLLSEAIDILQPILDRAVDQSEREKIGTDLAELLLAMDRPNEVLSILDRSTRTGNHDSKELTAQRQIIRAQALIKLDRMVEALEHIQDLQTSSARHLRAEIFWKQREWARLAAVIESFLNDPNLSTPMNYNDQKLILWLALSWDQLGLTGRLSELRENYIDEMASSPWFEAFVLTTQVRSKRRNIPSVLADVDQHLDELRDFRNSSKANP